MFAQNKIHKVQKVQTIQTNQETENVVGLLSKFSLLPDLQFHAGTKSSLCYTPRHRKAGSKTRFCPYAPIRTKMQKRTVDLVELHGVQSINNKLSFNTPKRNSRQKRRFSPFKHT